jgi:hypothetical protein
MTAEFFAQDLPDGIEAAPAAGKASTPEERLETFVTKVARFVEEPDEGRCHLADLHVSATRGGDTVYDGTIRYVRGAGERFRLEGDWPGIGRVGFGQGTSPWILSGEESVQYGRAGEEATVRDPLAQADPGDRVKLRVVAGALSGVAMAPSILETLVDLEDDTGADQAPVIRLRLRGRRERVVRLAYSQDGETPRSLMVTAEVIRVTVSFRDFRTHAEATPALFEPPGGVPIERVGRDLVYRRFGGLLRSALRGLD